jgi:hypothetical protein
MTKKANLSITWNGSFLLVAVLLLLIPLLKILNLLKMYQKSEIGLFVYGYLVNTLKFDPDTAKYITAQAAHETGNFTSEVLKTDNNLFGMTYVGQRLSLGKDKFGYARYDSLESCIKDYARYYAKAKYPQNFLSADNFVEALHDHRYFEADLQEYKKGVNFFYKIYFNA